MAHRCHATGCSVEVPPALWGCKKHWAMVPKALQRLVWEHYAAGQENLGSGMGPSPEYLRVARAAVRSVARMEGIEADTALYDRWLLDEGYALRNNPWVRAGKLMGKVVWLTDVIDPKALGGVRVRALVRFRFQRGNPRSFERFHDAESLSRVIVHAFTYPKHAPCAPGEYVCQGHFSTWRMRVEARGLHTVYHPDFKVNSEGLVSCVTCGQRLTPGA